ncbi:MAG: glycosyltransferase [Pseudomonadota bacterium]
MSANALSRTRVSVVALTRERPKEFRTLLEALARLRMTDFEVIVVGAAPRPEDHGASPALARRITYAQCVDQNISRSRNIGIALATGEIVAFIDDDAAPEPDWLDRLLPGFNRKDVGGVGGFVRGRNGVDYQWHGAVVDRYGAHKALTAEDLSDPALGAVDGEHFVSTVGVNGAYRREALLEIGGFDENFHYFLDESDVCVRLLSAGWRTIIAPEAEVHHAYAESSERRANRAPRDLFQIAASRVYFGRIHGHPYWYDNRIELFIEDQTQRMTKFVQLGRISRRQADQILQRLREGLVEGERRAKAGPILMQANAPTPPHRPADAPFRPPATARRPRVALVIAATGRGAIENAARRLADRGFEVTLIDFQLRARRLRVWFEDGVWRHVGGVLGRDQFGAPMPAPRRCLRVKRELDRVAARRDFDAVIRPTARKFQIGDLRAAPLSGRLRGYAAEPLRPGGEGEVIAALAAPATP